MPFKQLDSNVNATQNLLIVPTGVACGTGGHREEQLLDAFTKKRDLTTPETNLSVFIPEDGNIYHDGFATIAECAITHSPSKRAEMLYEGICAKEGNSVNSPFKFNHIYITGGFDTGEVIAELEKLIREKGGLPKRKDNLKVFGFSDASQLHHYLGQRGIATPMYYCADAHCCAWDLAEGKQIEPFQLTAVNDKAKEVEVLTGYTQPGSQVSVESQKTHQTALFNDNNLLIPEFRRTDEEGIEEIKSFVETISKFDKPITLVLSKDSSEAAVKALKEFLKNNEKLKNIPIFLGAPVGHGLCMLGKNVRAIPLFAEATIKKRKDGHYEMMVTEKASDRIQELSLSDESRRKEAPIETKEPTTRDIYITGEAGSAGVIISNLDYIEKNAINYRVHLPKDRYPVQMIKGTICKLIAKGIINKEKLESLVFDYNYKLSDKELESRQKYMEDFLTRHFVHPPKISYITAPNIPLQTRNPNSSRKVPSTSDEQLSVFRAKLPQND